MRPMTRRHARELRDTKPAYNYHLPDDILSDIISYLDPGADRTTLHNLLLVSHAVNNITLPVLYERLKLTESQFTSLIAGACDQRGLFSASSSSRFSLVQHLTLCPPPSADTMAPVYAAVEGAGELLLFPGVRTLCLDHRDHWKQDDFYFRNRRNNRWGGQPGLPPKHLALFDCPDGCIRGQYYAVDALAYLPSRNVSTSTLTVHTGSLDAITKSGIPRGWRRLVVYDTDVEGFQLHSLDFKAITRPVEGWAEERVVVYFGNNEREDSIRRMLEVDAQYLPYWPAPPSECLVFDDNAPPCTVCGRRWEDFWDEADAFAAAEDASA